MVAYVLSLIPVVAGLALSAWRFRVHDPLGGLAGCLGGLLLTIVLAVWLSNRGEMPRDSR